MPAPPAPPISVRGVLAAIRWPTGQDLLFSIKATLAVGIALYIGFRENLENPYWSAMTVYILIAQPQAGAIRSKALFRLGGTALGGLAAIALVGLFGSDVGVLLASTCLVILLSLFLKLLDRTPASDLWAATAMTAAVVGLAHATAPDTIFATGVARMVEIGLGVLTAGVIDSLIAPRPQTRTFLAAMETWRDAAAAFAAEALAADATDDPPARATRRQALHAIAAQTGVLDMQSVQLPFDVVDDPVQRRELRLLRQVVAQLIGQLATAYVWIEARRSVEEDARSAGLWEMARAWLATARPNDPEPAQDHGAEASALAGALRVEGQALIEPAEEAATLRGVALLRISDLIEALGVFDRLLRSMATGSALDRSLLEAARQARPRRSLDYLATALDILPVALGLGACAGVWYFTAWTAGVNAMLITFIASSFVVGTPRASISALGLTFWFAVAFGLTFLYQFVVLPQVTAFPVLMGVLAMVLIPVGILMTMSVAGLLIVALTFSFLALQGAYAGDFNASLQSLAGTAAGCLCLIAALQICQFNEPKFRARRQAQALARDVAEAAGARSVVALDAYMALEVNRMSLFYTATAGLTEKDPLRALDLVGRFRIGVNVLRLRRAEKALAPPASAAAVRLRRALASAFRAAPDRLGPEVLERADEAFDILKRSAPSPARVDALAALAGLRLSLRRDAPLVLKPRTVAP